MRVKHNTILVFPETCLEKLFDKYSGYSFVEFRNVLKFAIFLLLNPFFRLTLWYAQQKDTCSKLIIGNFRMMHCMCPKIIIETSIWLDGKALFRRSFYVCTKSQFNILVFYELVGCNLSFFLPVFRAIWVSFCNQFSIVKRICQYLCVGGYTKHSLSNYVLFTHIYHQNKLALN